MSEAVVIPINDGDVLEAAVAANVRAHAGLRGWKQIDIAQRMGVAQQTVSLKWWGRKRPWSVADIAKLADIFGCQPADLLAHPEGFEPPTFWLGGCSDGETDVMIDLNSVREQRLKCCDHGSVVHVIRR